MNKTNIEQHMRFFDWVCEYAEARHGKMPTLRAIMAAGLYNSTSSAKWAMDALVNMGLLEKHSETDEDRTMTYYSIVDSVFKARP